MRSRRPLSRLTKPHRFPVVVAALIALLSQIMTPGSAMAAEAAMSRGAMACDMPSMAGMSGDMAGMHHEQAEAPVAHHGGKGFAGLPCQDCLVPATAALPASMAAPVPISYATAYIRHVAFVRFRIPPARGPPRPFGQGPPTSDV